MIDCFLNKLMARWAERRRRILIIVLANLCKQWRQELQDKFSLQGLILETIPSNSKELKMKQDATASFCP